MSAPGIVVLGAPRSGTTLLRRLLSAHPHIHAPPETNLLAACGRFLRETPSGHGLSIGVRSGLAFSGVGEERVLHPLRALVTGVMGELAAAAGKRRWAEKSAFDAFHLDEIEQLLGESVQYVVVYRHGLDVVASMHELANEMETQLPDLHPYVAAHLSPFLGYAHAWADLTRRLVAFEAAHPQVCVRVRYEDLVADPRATLTRLFDALGEPADVDEIIAVGTGRDRAPGLGDWKTYGTTSIEPGRVGRGKALSASTVARVAEVLAPALALVGYAPIDVPRRRTEADARRQYQIQAQVARLAAERGEKQ